MDQVFQGLTRATGVDKGNDGKEGNGSLFTTLPFIDINFFVKEKTMQISQQTPMPSPPTAITTKDLSYLKDAMSWELLAFKKFHFYAQQVNDLEIKQAFEQAGQMHQNHYQRLLSHLQVNNDAIMANVPNPNQGQQH